MNMTTAVAAADDMIVCKIDGALCHSIRVHLKHNHPEWTIDRYKEEFPGEPLLSAFGEAQARKIRAQKQAEERRKERMAQFQPSQPWAFEERYMHEVFGIDTPIVGSAGQPIKINYLTECHPEAEIYLQDIDPDYVFNIDLLKKANIAYELNMPFYAWGFHGTGKTTLLEQTAARTGRPFLRVQHTGNTEEAHIVGQYVVKTIPVEEEELGADGVKHRVIKQKAVTEFQPGPLAVAMKYGMVYCADEYDFAMPSVIALYQPVLEGKALVIKDAPPEWRVTRPHPDFRFVATGNTNGSGDETGLYQGTMMQNAASYSRFTITEEVKYMPKEQEALVLRSRTGLTKADAMKFVEVATAIREAFATGLISMPVSPREIIGAAKLSIIYGDNPKQGLRLAYTNRCTRVDQKAVDDVAQRYFG
jgi:cobaltochelatase CobS